MRSILGSIVVSLVAVLALSACGDKGGPGGGGGVVGSYELDREAARRLFEDEMKANLPEGMSATDLKPMIDEMMKTMRVDIDVKSDHTFVGRSSMEVMGQKNDSSSKGTWKQDGNQVHFTTTEEDGQKSEYPETMTATYADGRLSLTKDRKTIVLKKK